MKKALSENSLGQPDVGAVGRQREALLRHPAETSVHPRLEGADAAEPVHQVTEHEEAWIAR